MKYNKLIRFKINISFFIILIIFSSIALSGCDERGRSLTPEEKRFIGTWFGGGIVNEVVAFFPDGTCSFYLDLSGKWKVEDEELTIDLKEEQRIFTYEFLENETVLGLYPNGSTIPYIFRKQ